MHKVEDLDHVVETMSHRVDKTQGLVSIIQGRYDSIPIKINFSNIIDERKNLQQTRDSWRS